MPRPQMSPLLKAAALHRELSMVHTNILSYLACVPGRRAKDIVAESGLEVERFNAIGQASAQDESLRARVALAQARSGE